MTSFYSCLGGSSDEDEEPSSTTKSPAKAKKPLSEGAKSLKEIRRLKRNFFQTKEAREAVQKAREGACQHKIFSFDREHSTEELVSLKANIAAFGDENLNSSVYIWNGTAPQDILFVCFDALYGKEFPIMSSSLKAGMDYLGFKARQTWYLEHVELQEILEEGVPAKLIRRFLETLYETAAHYKKVYVFGSSMGGTGAIMYGAFLRQHSPDLEVYIVAHAPQINLGVAHQSKQFVETHIRSILSDVLSEGSPPLNLGLLVNQDPHDLNEAITFFQDILTKSKCVNHFLYLQSELKQHEMQMTEKFQDLLEIYKCLESLAGLKLKGRP